MRKCKALFYSNGLYTLLLYLLVGDYKVKETLFLFSENTYLSSHIKNRINYYLLKSRKNKYYSIIYCVLFIRFLSLKYRNTTLYVVSNNFFIHFFNNIIAFEDGLLNYVMGNTNISATSRKNKLLNWFVGPSYPDYGYSDKIRKIYLTGIQATPKALEEKAEIINIQQLWNSKSSAEQQEIISFFFSDDFNISRYSGRKTLLLTQTLSERGFTTEEDKIILYKALLASFDESDLIIKIHPGETTDYSAYFPKAIILDYPCPMELLSLMGLQIKTAVTVNSTAIYSLDKSVSKITLGTDVLSVLSYTKGEDAIKQLVTDRYHREAVE